MRLYFEPKSEFFKVRLRSKGFTKSGYENMMTHQLNKFDSGDSIQAITFDAVGTLIVPHPSVGAVYAEELSILGYELNPDALEKKFINAFRQFKQDHPDVALDRDSWRVIVANTLLGLTPEEDFDRQFRTLWNAFIKPERWSILSGVEKTLQSLQAEGMRLFVLSNNDERLHDILNGLGIGQYFETVFVSAELGTEKPSKRIFELVQERINVAPENILHVGDSPVEDIQGALQAGWSAALIGSGNDAGINMPVNRATGICELFSGSSR